MASAELIEVSVAVLVAQAFSNKPSASTAKDAATEPIAPQCRWTVMGNPITNVAKCKALRPVGQQGTRSSFANPAGRDYIDCIQSNAWDSSCSARRDERC